MKVSSQIDQYPGAGTFPHFPASIVSAEDCAALAAVTIGSPYPKLVAVGYAVVERAEPVIRWKRHRSTAAKFAARSLGGSCGVH
jgi:hypothetical protein